jgi:F-type H+-transporting ATPase subunit a
VELGPDARVLFEWGLVRVTATLAGTWVLMLGLVAGSRLVTGRLTSGLEASRPQLFLELVVTRILEQIEGAAPARAQHYLAFVGSLFLFVAGASLLSVVPGYPTPTASLSTAAALAACVFFAVPVYGIAERGWRGYFGGYLKPTPLMLPFHLIGEFSRTLALAVRLFGNILSGELIVAILLSIVPFVFPAVLQAFGLLIGAIQAYVFAVLALVYVISASRSHEGAAARRGRDAPGDAR